ncbi:hypothetical protein NSK_008761 [Nannochloropsis salina CCMP1776]|uniref:Uncharacterized protein n=1 Tax=Nannochloropsis salina CCMP1776 TaxID=1027361 RepID=A0A4D9CN18_9STRA|nr:hypothetical protein NSK_008761 [Nannochloropsis salina CCMP1776]|eukprot:TFJ79904.1 hypothetical protein NSK_008761 [Nannochloropsis salina CCMP1776]
MDRGMQVSFPDDFFLASDPDNTTWQGQQTLVYHLAAQTIQALIRGVLARGVGKEVQHDEPERNKIDSSRTLKLGDSASQGVDGTNQTGGGCYHSGTFCEQKEQGEWSVSPDVSPSYSLSKPARIINLVFPSQQHLVPSIPSRPSHPGLPTFPVDRLLRECVPRVLGPPAPSLPWQPPLWTRSAPSAPKCPPHKGKGKKMPDLDDGGGNVTEKAGNDRAKPDGVGQFKTGHGAESQAQKGLRGAAKKNKVSEASPRQCPKPLGNKAPARPAPYPYHLHGPRPVGTLLSVDREGQARLGHRKGAGAHQTKAGDNHSPPRSPSHAGIINGSKGCDRRATRPVACPSRGPGGADGVSLTTALPSRRYKQLLRRLVG